MSFTSLSFFLFLGIVFLLYWSCRQYRNQNFIILVASYTFYCCWDWHFALLLAFTTLSSFFSGVFLEKYSGNARLRYKISAFNIVINLFILGIFKYFNFFADSLISLVNAWGGELDYVTIKILLPVGISFYTFKALSYSIDVYRNDLKATKDFIAFAAYLSFFVELPAGPIDKATNLVPQFLKNRLFRYDYAVDGVRQILWGLFKKVVVANNCALYVNTVFADYSSYSWLTLTLAGSLFTIQIYGDFSGYSDIAIGIGKLFGFDLMRNFSYPYFSRNIAEFWRRWHISLTSWFRNYVYIPLGGSRCSKVKIVRNTFIVYLISGLWHGANWTFVVWGAYHAILFLPLILTGNNKKYKDTVAQGKIFPSYREFIQILATFILASIGWIIFRADSIYQAYDIIYGIFVGKTGEMLFGLEYLLYIGFAVIMFIIEWVQRDKEHSLQLSSIPIYFRWPVYFLVFSVIYLFLGNEQTFIYMQF